MTRLVQLLFVFFVVLRATTTQDKFRGRATVENVGFGLDATTSSLRPVPQCFHDIDIIWHKKLETPFYSTPIVTDLFGDGRKDIIAVGLDYAFALAGDNGEITTGDWPVGLSSDSFIASPLLYDVDDDGNEEIVLATIAGLIIFVSPEGFIDTSRVLQVPPTYIRKDWYQNQKETQTSGNGQDEFKTENQNKSDKNSNAYWRLFPDLKIDENLLDEDSKMIKQKLWEHFAKKLTPEGLKSLELFLPSKADFNGSSADWIPTNLQNWQTNNPPPHDIQNYIAVPPHLLSPPVIADIEGDGNVELVAAVSYYFEDGTILEEDLDPHNYVASGVVVFDLETMDIKWETTLDFTTDFTKYKGYVYGPPTVVDLDDDGKLETIVGTATGIIYVLDSSGLWNSEMGQMMLDVIYGGITAEDVLGDGTLQLIATDAVGNVVCFNNQGDEIWENQVIGVVHQNPVVGDVNADGVLDVVVATTSGAVYAFSGDTGSIVPHFPIKLGDPIYSQPLLMYMRPEDTQLHIIVHTYHGHIFIINAFDGCVESVDIGGGSFSMLVADDLTGNGNMELVVATQQGDIYLLGTDSPYHPLNSWPSPVRGRNVLTVSKNIGILIDDSTRFMDHISGKTFPFTFYIIDKRENKGKNLRYTILITFGGQTLFNDTFYTEGPQRVEVSCPKSTAGSYVVTQGIVKITMVNQHGQVYQDEFHTNFNFNFHKTIKWILVIPFLGMCFTLAFVSEIKALLPS